MENRRYDKLRASFEATQPPLPPDFTERVMREIGQKPDVKKSWKWIAAACLIIVIGMGVTMLPITEKTPREVVTFANTVPKPTKSEEMISAEITPTVCNVAEPTKITARKEKPSLVFSYKDVQCQKPLRHSTVATTPTADRLNDYISRLETEMDALDDSVRKSHVEKLIAADARLQQLVYRIVKGDVEQAVNELEKDSTANYINF